MGILKDYIDEATKTIMRMNPSLNKDDVRKIITRITKEKVKDPTIIMDNNVTGDNATITLTKMCDWVERRNPVVSGNATFYCQPEEIESPTSGMLRSLKKERKSVKNEMWKFNPRSSEYAMLDLDQGNKKVIMNAEYGGSGAPTAAFYTEYSPPATTLMAQSIITIMAAFFEGFIGDNQVFFSINECFDWMNHVVKKDKDIPKWVIIPTKKEVTKRIVKHFSILGISDYSKIDSYIGNCSERELVYLYYANNLNEFIGRHPNIGSLVKTVLAKLPNYVAAEKEVPAEFTGKFEADEFSDEVEKYNKWISGEMFLNPYKPPKQVEDDLEQLAGIIMQFIYVEYLTPDSIVKLNNHKRNTVLLVDTDSNIINADLFVDYILKNVLRGDTFGRHSLYNEMILVNVLAFMVDKCVVKMLDYYGRTHHMNKEARAELTMKNEFMFRRFFIMKTKKRYAASIVLREGNIIIPFKLEIKGMDFIKAGVTQDVKNRFTTMLEKHILFSEELELHELMKDLKNFEREIYQDLSHGGVRFLKPQQYKAEGAYKQIIDENGNVIGSKAWSLPVFRGAAVWNELYPRNKIYSLDRVKIVKLIVTKEEDLDIIKDKYPKEYQMVMEKIYQSPSAEIRKAGFRVISLPSTEKEIPEWIIPLVDKDIIVSDVISSFRSVLEALRLEEVYFKTPNGNANLTSCMISL